MHRPSRLVQVWSLVAVSGALGACASDGATPGTSTDASSASPSSSVDPPSVEAGPSSNEGGSGPDDGGADAASEAGDDATTDADVASDAGGEAATDAAIDAPADVALDAPVDGPIDAPADAGVDAAKASCGKTPHGGTESRTCYASASVPPAKTCTGTTQTRTCNDGVWSPDYASCAALACTVQTNDATCDLVTAPSTVLAGKPFQASVTMRNTGTSTWLPFSSGTPTPWRLGGLKTWGVERVELPTSIGPGGVIKLDVTPTAPATAGTHAFQWRMVQEAIEFFGDLCNTSLQVTTCGNGIKDGDEGDVDCGGSCAKCGELASCATAFDCATGSCYQNRCVSARVAPTAANADYFLSRSCYGIHAFRSETGEDATTLASHYRGCKLIRWVDYTWYDDAFAGFDGAYFAKLSAFANAVHANDPETVLEAAFAEFTCIPLYDRTVYDFSTFPELTAKYGYSGTGTFDGASMVRPGTEGQWGVDCSKGATFPPVTPTNNGVTAAASAETMRALTWLAARYARAGFEAFYLPQSDLISANDPPTFRNLVQRIREVGAIYGRRKNVLIAGEVFRRGEPGEHAPNYGVLIDTQGRPVVDYMKAPPEVDLVRTDGTGATSAKPTVVAPYSPSCVEDARLPFESRVGRRLSSAQGDICYVDNTLSGRKYVPGAPDYGQQDAANRNTFWLPQTNEANIPVVLEMDGCQGVYGRGNAPWTTMIRDGISPQVLFFATRDAGARQTFTKYMPWAARSIFARGGVPTYAPLPVKEDQAWFGGCVNWNAYPEETFCKGSNATPSFYYEAQSAMCNDVSAVQAAIQFTPSDAGFALTTTEGRVVGVGGGFRTSLGHSAGDFGADAVVDLEIRDDQTGYDVLTASGTLVTYPSAAQTTGLVGARDIETFGANRLVLHGASNQCAIASSADGFVAKTIVAGCTQPARLATKPGVLALIERSGRLWFGQTIATLSANDALMNAITLSPGDYWVDAEYRSDEVFFAVSSFGHVVRVNSSFTVDTLLAAPWTFSIITDLEHLRSGGGEYLYMLDSWGGLHRIAVGTQTEASFPDIYPPPYYGGTFQGKYVGLHALSFR